MSLTPSDLKIIKKTGITVLVGMVVVIGITWLIQYSRIKRQNLELRFDESGQLVATNNTIVPFDIEAHVLVAKRFMETGQPEKALPHLKRSLAFRSGQRDLRFRFATASLDASRYEQALSALTKLEQNGINDSLTPAICAQKGITLFYLGRLSESKEHLENCLVRFPASKEAACYLGQIEASQSDGIQRAESYLEQAIRMDSSYVEAWYQLARLMMQKGNNIKARQLLLRGLEIDPLHVKSHSRLGMAYYYLNDIIQARKSYQTALALNPYDYNTRYNLGELYYSALGDTESALIEFKKTLQLHPGHVEALFKTGMICLGNNMVKEAIRHFEAALAQEPGSVRILLQLAVAFEKIGDQDRALRSYKNIIKVDPLNRIAKQKIKFLSNE
jgi:tetratricopeptide (TPR) repeat protein